MKRIVFDTHGIPTWEFSPGSCTIGEYLSDEEIEQHLISPCLGEVSEDETLLVQLNNGCFLTWEEDPVGNMVPVFDPEKV